MPKKIVVNGCSYTQEHYFETDQKWSTKIGCTTNLASGGGSNERIFHTTIQHLNNEDPDILIIGWTSVDRAMLHSVKGTRVIVTPGRTFDEELGIDYEHIRRFYYTELHNKFVALINTLNYMIHLQNFCKLKNIKLLYWNALLPGLSDIPDFAKSAFMSRVDNDTEQQGIIHNKNILEQLISRLDKSIWIKQFWYGIDDHCKEFKWRDDGHVDEEGSAHWAKLVKQYL